MADYNEDLVVAKVKQCFPNKEQDKDYGYSCSLRERIL